MIEAVLAAAPGTTIFYEILPGGGLSSGCKSIAEKHQREIIHIKEIRELLLPTVTLKMIFDEVTQPDIHWLKIDVEGMEESVLTGWLDHHSRPWIVIVEATEPNTMIPTYQIWEHHLLNRDYVFTYFDGLNRFYIHNNHRELIPTFATPPNVFDNYKL